MSTAMEPAAPPQASLLLVDDHGGNLVTLQAILAPLGHELVSESSGVVPERVRAVLTLLELDGYVGSDDTGWFRRR